jgi:hypothetical protein
MRYSIDVGAISRHATTDLVDRQVMMNLNSVMIRSITGGWGMSA